jgi:hypothetical protein
MKVSTKLKASFSRLLLLTAFLCISLSAKAVDWIDLQLGTEYEVPNLGEFYGKFTAPKSGIVTVSFTGGYTAPKPFYDEALEKEVAYNNSSSGYDFNAVGGTNYYIGTDWAQQGGTIVLSMSEDNSISLVEASPAAGSVLDLGAGAQVNFLFSNNVQVTDGAILYGTNGVAALDVHASGTAITSELRTVLYNLLSNGKVKGGDEITVQLTGVRASSDESVLYNGDGVFEIKYICPELPTSLVSETVLDKFLSYWLPTDESGLMTLTFTGELDPTAARVVFCYGNVEGAVGEYYEETIPYTVSGNTMTINCTGVVRDPKSMIKSGYVYSVCRLKVLSVRDVNGAYIYTPYSGSLGSFTYDIPFAMASGKYVVEITPESGADLDGYNNIEVYISGTDNVYYDGLQVAYTDANGRQTEVLTEADYTVEIDGDEATYTIPVKEAWKNGSDVVVSLRNFMSKAGESNGSEAKYNAFVVSGINPTSGSTLGFLQTGDVVSVTTNRSKQIKNFVYEIHDLNAETADDFVIKSLSYLSTDADSITWSADVYGSYKFYTGHKYSFVFKAYNTQSIAGAPFATDSIVINGGTTPYVYSDTQFISITPEAGTTLTDATQNTFKVEFDGIVCVDSELSFINLGQGATLPFAQVKSESDSTSFSNIWYLSLPEDYLAQHPGHLSLTIVAYDVQGKRVQGNQGEEEGTYFSFTYTNTVGVPEITCAYPYEGQQVESLSYLIISCADGIDQAYSGDKIEVKNALTGETVATVVETEPIFAIEDSSDPGYWDQAPVAMYLYLDQTLTEGGRYYAVIPEGYFYLGSAAQYTSDALTIGIVIAPKEEAAATNVEADPASGSVVTSLSEIVLTFVDESIASPDYNYESSVQVLDADGNVVSGVSMEYGIGWNQVNVTLKNEVTADGTYRIVFPEGAILFGEDGDESSSAFTLTYYIGVEPEAPAENVTPVEADPADGTTVTSLKEIGLTFTAEEAVGEEWNCSDPINVTDAAGNVVATAELGWGVEYNQMVATLSQEITAAGTYTITFPAGKFALGEDGDRWSTAFTLTYTIGAAEATTPVEADPADGTTVTSLKEIGLTFTAEEAVGEEWNCSDPINVTDAEGNVVATAELGWGVEYNQMVATLSQEITADGTYTITFPAGKFALGEDGLRWSTAFTLTYTIGAPTGINGIAADQVANLRVYNLQGACVLRNADAAAVKALPAGIYVINGVKTVIR